MEDNHRQTDTKLMATTWIIWAAMLCSLMIYVVVGHFAIKQIDLGGMPPPEMLRVILAGVGVVLFFLAKHLRKNMLRGVSLGGAARVEGQQVVDSDSVESKYMIVMLISLALSEAIGIFGLVLFFLSEDYLTLFLFIGCSAIAMFIFRPKFEELEQLRRITQTTHINS